MLNPAALMRSQSCWVFLRERHMAARRHDKEKIELMERVLVSKAILKLAFPVFMVIQAAGNILGVEHLLIFYDALGLDRRKKHGEQVRFLYMLQLA